MSNYIKTKTEVYNYICARTPLIIIESSERERVERMLREIAMEMSIDLPYYTDVKQVINLGRNSSAIDVDSDPLPYIVDYFKKKRGATFAFGDVKRVSDDNSYSRELLNILYLAKENNATLVLITSDSIWSRLAQFGMITLLDYPDVDERIAIINAFIKTYRDRFTVDWDTEDVRKAAMLLRGFTEIQIENILSTTIITDRGLYKKKIYELTKQKNRLYASVSSIQMVQVSQSLKVSGLEALKSWLKEKKCIFFASDDELEQRNLQTPKGILLAGIPGCGKSYSAKMIAKEWELPLFRFDIGTIYDKWVGGSEKRMKEALQFIDNVAPCVLWIDEIEKALSVSDTGNDTGKRVLGQFLFWLQESGSRVFLVATANDITLLPTELFRKGRFSEVFFIDLPNEEERQTAITQYAEKSLHICIGRTEIEELVRISEGFSYSDIEYAIKDIAQIAIIRGQSVINHQILMDKFKSIVPISKSNPEMIDKVQKWGRERASLASGNLGGVNI
jgi:ATP-dependent 26S proteasome regulatory subunit